MKLIPRFHVAGYLSTLFLAAVLPFAPVARAASTSSGSLDINFFYDSLKDQGAWFNTTGYGDVWQPYIAYKNESWRPYTDGYWTYTDGGWMFVSYEDFGWAVYHYGRWTHLKDIGWAWVPGTEWAPAWVAWRSSDPDGAGTLPDVAKIAATTTDKDTAAPPPTDAGSGPDASDGYVGWAPLPPEAMDNANYAYGPTVDADYGIDPYDYCFTDVRSFGAPWIGGVLFGPDRGYECCGRSYNVTRYAYDRQGAYRGVFVGGPNFDRLRGRTAQPLRQVAITRQAARNAARISQVNERNASVFAPRFSRQGMGRDGRVQFSRQRTLAKADVVPGAQRGGGANVEAQGRAREAIARQAQEARQRNPQPAATGGRKGDAQKAGQAANPPGAVAGRSGRKGGNRREAVAGPQARARAVSAGNSRQKAARSGSGRQSRGNHSGGGGGGGHRGGNGGGHGGGHAGGGGGGGQGHGGGGGGKKH